ncbi:hypothetical protein DPMN_028349 [Dreissena polymorpha]|uniref:Uncharacterized protein n=1 Tax=Dreissena polymorpha TaxID=45954 RepID=A0A9D4LUK1_DREPO|nr:hypothetical protein DPMN_028349 [Dreissena polymorpha]
MEDTAEFGREITQDSKAALLAHLPRGLTWPQIHEIMQEPYNYMEYSDGIYSMLAGKPWKLFHAKAEQTYFAFRGGKAKRVDAASVVEAASVCGGKSHFTAKLRICPPDAESMRS